VLLSNFYERIARRINSPNREPLNGIEKAEGGSL
jgi:hypothetical protein